MAEKDNRFNLRLSKDTLQRLRELARKTGLTMSEIVRRFVNGESLNG